MKKFLNTMFFTMLLIVVAGAGIFAGFNAINSRENNTASVPLDIYQAADVETPPAVLSKPLPEQSNATEALLNYDAVLVFEYRNRDNGSVTVEEKALPYFLAGKGIEDLSAVFSGWQIENYNEHGALLKKDIARPTAQYYIVKAKDGFIAVFYDESIDGSKLKEITDTPVTSLPETERVRLNSGIRVQGEAALMRLLEDLSS